MELDLPRRMSRRYSGSRPEAIGSIYMDMNYIALYILYSRLPRDMTSFYPFSPVPQISDFPDFGTIHLFCDHSTTAHYTTQHNVEISNQSIAYLDHTPWDADWRKTRP